MISLRNLVLHINFSPPLLRSNFNSSSSTGTTPFYNYSATVKDPSTRKELRSISGGGKRPRGDSRDESNKMEEEDGG